MTARKARKSNSFNRISEIPDFLSVQKMFMQAAAMYPIDYTKILPKSLEFLSPALNCLYYLIVLFISFHIALLHAITAITTFGKTSLDDFSDILTLTIIYSFTFFTGFYFLLRQKLCVELFRYLNEHFRTRSAPGLTYLSAKSTYQTIRCCAIIWIVMCLAGVILWAVFPILIGKRVLPLGCWYPFDQFAPVSYEIVYVLQFLGQIECGLAFGMGSCCFMSMVQTICGQFDVLFCSLKNVYYTALLMDKKNQSTELFLVKQQQEISLKFEIRKGINDATDQHNEDENAEELNQYIFKTKEHFEDIKEARRYFNEKKIEKTIETKRPSGSSNAKRKRIHKIEFVQGHQPLTTPITFHQPALWRRKATADDDHLKFELKQALRNCIEHHEQILHVCKLFEDFYNPFCLVKSLQVTFQICFLAFVFVNTSTTSSLRIIILAEYLFLTLAEWLMYNYYGEVLQQHSVRVSDALMRGPWHLFATKLKKDMLILLPSVLRPAKLTGGKFFNINIERFRLIVTTSFSYFTLLQNLGADKNN